ncbi:unnamed protein product [Schistosoma mattheei]|uniref:Uncharacterized protein n=1 Tax=Schistosoma mattheei TaxID=31246 RepID=A0A3P8HXX6_9TREM|nr:unnamed protein product [Schistosoma mattheei]
MVVLLHSLVINILKLMVFQIYMKDGVVKMMIFYYVLNNLVII